MADPTRTYDQQQREAQLITCTKCGNSYYMTVPRPLCVRCQEQETR